MIYPYGEGGAPREAGRGGHRGIETASLPNRFVCRVQAPPGEAARLARAAEGEAKKALEGLCAFAVFNVFPGDGLGDPLLGRALEQVDAFLEVFWAVEPLDPGAGYPGARQQLEKHLASLKNHRRFQQNGHVYPNKLVVPPCHVLSPRRQRQ